MTFSFTPPVLPDPAKVPALRWGIIGTGIADRFVGAIHATTGQRAHAVTARDAEKTAAFAAKHGVPVVHESVEELVADPEIDVVYIATPHPLHEQQALAAIAAGKHVLIEKPIAMDAEEAERILAAGRERGVLVMEAMWTRYIPQAYVIRQVVADGVLGEVRRVSADFGFSIPFMPEHRLYNAELGGGALLDAGVYPISFASSVLGEPASIVAVGTHAPTGVDDRADLLLTTDSGATALLSTSLVAVMPITATIEGSVGRLDVASPFFGPSAVTVTIGQFGDAERTTWTHDTSEVSFEDGIGYQATALAAYVAEGLLESPVHPHAEVASVMRTIGEARRQIAASVETA